MVPDLMGEYGPKIVVAVVGVGLALLCLVGILWIVRGRGGPSPFVRGGRNRNPRLQVLDAAAVDTRRRLVLVRRDDVEHLLMIGGPTDIVVESRILTAERRDESVGSGLESPTSGARAKVEQVTGHNRPAAEPAAVAIPREAMSAARPLDSDPKVREARAPIAAPAAAAPIARVQPAATAVPVEKAAAERLNPPVTAVSSTTAITPAARQPELGDAAVLLDSARDRVFAEKSLPAAVASARFETGKATPPAFEAAGTAVPSTDKSTAPGTSALGSEFERILEEEMASNMAAREAAVPARGTIAPSTPVAASAVTLGPAVPVPGTVAKQDPALQSEVARIFGEMSASRDK